MAALSLTPPERARKTEQTIRACLKGDETQAAIAAATGLSAATVNRLFNDHLTGFCAVLAQLGLKTVPVDFHCVSPEDYAFMTRKLERMAQANPKLMWESE